MKKGRITIRVSDVDKVTVVAYPKTQDNDTYALILEYLMNSKKVQDKIRQEITDRIFKVSAK
jgi:transcription initiation factor IIE alpha subunit